MITAFVPCITPITEYLWGTFVDSILYGIDSHSGGGSLRPRVGVFILFSKLAVFYNLSLNWSLIRRDSPRQSRERSTANRIAFTAVSQMTVGVEWRDFGRFLFTKTFLSANPAIKNIIISEEFGFSTVQNIRRRIMSFDQ